MCLLTENRCMCPWWRVCCRAAVAAVCLLFMLGVLITTPLRASQEASVKIAAVFSLTGIAAKHNAPMVNMVQLAVDTINSRGGVLGKNLELVILDNHSSPIGSAAAAQKAVNLGVVAVIGCHWSSHSLAMAPILQKAGIPMIAPASTNPAITLNRDYVFRVCFVDSFQGSVMAQFAGNDLGARRAAVVSNIDEKYSINLAQYFRNSFEEHSGTIVVDAQYRGDAIDFSSIIERIMNVRPDVVYIPGYTRDSGLFIRQARKMGVQATFLGGDGWDDIGTFAGEAIDGSYHTAAWHPMVPYAKSKMLKALHREMYDFDITHYNAPLAYDAVMLLKEAIVYSHSLDGSSIRDALYEMPVFRGATGRIALNENGDPSDKGVIIIRFEQAKPMYAKMLPAVVPSLQ